jgi:hypothetical protein
MSLMSDAEEWCKLLEAHGCQISAASRHYDILYMGLRSDAAEWCRCRLLEAHGCQAMPIFGSCG